MQVGDRDAEIMARIWRLVKGFPQLAAVCDPIGQIADIVRLLVTMAGQMWPKQGGAKQMKTRRAGARHVFQIM
ncbi:hypothetical protein G3572_12130 [Rhodobacter sp. ETT8]|uniref:Uncharacterized protein n=1 Tax=Pseudotabrizicola algicola TaxID=2709381 RepID=A0A6B3RLK8_9RHOB|nr:hypothetical protein [Pseudotabrizicola algicola]